MALKKVGKSPGIYQNTLINGDTVYYYSYKDSLGKKHNVKVGNKSAGITPTYAKNKRDERLNLLRNGEDPKAGKKQEKVLFSEVWDFYINNKNMGEGTRTDRKGRWEKHMKSYFSKEVTVDNLKKFREDKIDNLSETSIDMLIAFTGTASNYWNAEQIIRKASRKPHKAEVHNPVPDLRAIDNHHDIPKPKKVERERYLTLEEVNTLKAEVADHPDLNLFVHLALTTGGRLATIMSIKKMHIKGNKVTLINHKVGAKKYTGFLDADTQKLLTKRTKNLKASDTLFHLEQRQIQRRVQYIMNRLFNEELEKEDKGHRVTVHTLRHSFASHLVMNGTPIAKVQKLMSHKDISTTMIYSHLAPTAGADDVMGLWS